MTHAFERAGLGLAPFRYVGMHEKVYVAYTGAPVQPAGTCEYCGNGIRYCCQIRSADGKEFVVGTDCVWKVNAENNVANVQAMESDTKKLAREKRQARAQAKREKRQAEYQAKLQEQRDRNGGKTDWELQADAERAEQEAARAMHTEANRWLIDVLKGQPGSFCYEVVRDLQNNPLSNFSERCRSIMADIYAKSFGRRNSKAYLAALEAFDEKANLV